MQGGSYCSRQPRLLCSLLVCKNNSGQWNCLPRYSAFLEHVLHAEVLKKCYTRPSARPQSLLKSASTAGTARKEKHPSKRTIDWNEMFIRKWLIKSLAFLTLGISIDEIAWSVLNWEVHKGKYLTCEELRGLMNRLFLIKIQLPPLLSSSNHQKYVPLRPGFWIHRPMPLTFFAQGYRIFSWNC